MSEAPPPPKRPWWLPFSIPPGVGAEHIRLLGFVAFAMLFENYDLGLIGAALPQIAADFDLDDTGKGGLMAAIEMGSLAAFMIVPLADRLGRRRLLLACVVGMSLGSFLTAFAPGPAWLGACQVVTRSFASTASVVSFVIVAEEFPAHHRGWGIGVLGAVGAVGFGLGALVYAQVGWLPFGWRAVYAIGGLAIFLLPFFRDRIQETRRFQTQVASRSQRRFLVGAIEPVLGLLRDYPGRALILGGAALLSTAGHRPAFRFVSDFLQTTHGWSPGEYATMTIGLGAVGVFGAPLAGRLGDRYGRRLIGAAMLVPFPLIAAFFFLGPSAWVGVPWMAMVFASMASGVVQRTFATELFPTSMRSSAGGWVLLVETLGASIGLFAFATLVAQNGNLGLSLTLVALACVAGALVLLFLPDTHQRELESISGEDGPAPAPPPAPAARD
jgi:putative MFS transporter